MPYLNAWLIRHGETEVNTGLWSANPNDTHLTQLGMAQAKKSAEHVLKQPDLFIVSPLIRARETSQFFVNKWPETPVINLPIQEFIYLSPKRLSQLGREEIREQINGYWQKCDPYFCDGPDSESFTAFLQRVSDFHSELLKRQGYIIVIGHGEFFKAFQLGLTYGFIPNPNWMQLYYKQETIKPIRNGEIIKLVCDYSGTLKASGR